MLKLFFCLFICVVNQANANHLFRHKNTLTELENQHRPVRFDSYLNEKQGDSKKGLTLKQGLQTLALALFSSVVLYTNAAGGVEADYRPFCKRAAEKPGCLSSGKRKKKSTVYNISCSMEQLRQENSPESANYTRALLEHSLRTWSQNGSLKFLDPSICVSVLTHPGGSAAADIENNKLVVTTGLIAGVEEREFRAVLAHELAHFILEHQGRFPESTFAERLTYEERIRLKSNSSIEIAANREFLALFTKAKQILPIQYVLMTEAFQDLILSDPELFQSRQIYYEKIGQIAAEKKMCGDKCDIYLAWMSRLGSLEDSYLEAIAKNKIMLLQYFSESEIANQAELDADKLGLEIYTLSGGKPLDYLLFDMRMLRDEEEQNPDTCLHEGLTLSARGKARHPDVCWKLQYLNDYLQKNSDYFESLEVLGTGSPSFEFLRSQALNELGKTLE